MRLIDDDAVERLVWLGAATHRLLRDEGRGHLGANSGDAPRLAKNGRSDDERPAPITCQRERNEGLSSAYLLTDDTASMGGNHPRRATDRVALILAQRDLAEALARQRTEARVRQYGACASQSIGGGWRHAGGGATRGQSRRDARPGGVRRAAAVWRAPP